MLALGCAAAPRTAGPGGDSAAEVLRAIGHGAGPLPQAQLDPQAFIPHSHPSGKARVTTDGVAETRDIHDEPTGPMGWTFHVEGLRSVTYRYVPEAGLVIEREDDLERGASVEYDPPIPAWPTSAAVEGESEVTVRSADGARVRDRGTIRYRVEALGWADVPGESGESGVTRYAITRSSRTFDLGLADAEAVTVTAFGSARGVVAEWGRRDVRALGLFGGVRERTIERVPQDAQP